MNRQVPVPVVYKGARLEASCRTDLLVEGKLVVEVKAVERILPVHDAQILTCTKMSRSPVGLLLNFNTAVLKDGIRRFVNRRAAEGGRATRSEEILGAAEPRAAEAAERTGRRAEPVALRSE